MHMQSTDRVWTKWNRTKKLFSSGFILVVFLAPFIHLCVVAKQQIHPIKKQQPICRLLLLLFLYHLLLHFQILSVDHAFALAIQSHHCYSWIYRYRSHVYWALRTGRQWVWWHEAYLDDKASKRQKLTDIKAWWEPVTSIHSNNLFVLICLVCLSLEEIFRTKRAKTKIEKKKMVITFFQWDISIKYSWKTVRTVNLEIKVCFFLLYASHYSVTH